MNDWVMTFEKKPQNPKNNTNPHPPKKPIGYWA